MPIHSTAVIADGAQIDLTANIGPYAIIGANVKIGAGTTVGAHSVIDGFTTIGKDCKFFPGVSVGLEPQDLSYKGEETGVIIGDRVTLREYVTVHRATKSGFTIVGDDCFLMANAHVAHNCVVGKGVIMANLATLGGYVTVGDNAVFGGMVVIHQNCRVGRMAMIGGLSGSRQDLPPFGMCDGRPVQVIGINQVGLKRNKVSLENRMIIKKAFRMIYRAEDNISTVLERIEKEVPQIPEVVELLDFFRTTKRGVATRNTGEDADYKDDFGDDKEVANPAVASRA